MKQTKLSAYFLPVLCILILGVMTSFAQSTGFTYQGSLNNSNLPATGNYDFEFKLFTALAGGTQDGTSRQVLNVPVTNGTFSAVIDFGAGAFPGADRFLEIAVRSAGGAGFTTLTPRQQINTTPYALKSSSADQASFAINANDAQNAVNSTQLGGVAANRFVQTNDSRLTDARNPLPDSTNYIQNGTTPQAASRFNITGNGTVGGTLTGNIVSATTQYNIGNDRVISSPGLNFFAGISAGISNTTGVSNAFFGRAAGTDNTIGSNNSFFGRDAGFSNTTAFFNSFFGKDAGRANTTGSGNSFFGYSAGSSNTTAQSNSFFGRDAGSSNTTGNLNSFFGFNAGSSNTEGASNTFSGTNAGLSNTTAQGNSFFGRDAGRENTTGNFNTFFGYNTGTLNTTGSTNTLVGIAANVNANNLTNATAIGANALVGQSNALILGGIFGVNGSPASTDVGIGTTTPTQKLDVNGNIRIGTGTTGCVQDRNGTVIAGACSSDLRFKKNITPFSNILSNFSKLRPVNYYWRTDEFADKRFGTNQSFGLVAQEVEMLFPELVATDEKGYKVVNYSKLPLYTIQAVKEQQVQIEQQRIQLQQQQLLIDGLKKFVCSQNPQAQVCK
jgi:Chaperone of endosialidase